MDGEYIFKEDSRKYRKPVLILTIMLYVSFIGMLAAILNLYLKHEMEQSLFIKLACLSSVFLLLAGYFTWGLLSNYLKYFMFISYTNMEFYSDKKIISYSTRELKSYTIDKKNNRYAVFYLNFFNGKCYKITSFKAQDFQIVLDRLLNVG